MPVRRNKTSTKPVKPVTLVFRALSPHQARWRDVLSRLIPLIVMIYQLFKLFQYESVPVQMWLEAILLPWLLFPAITAIFELFRHKAVIKMSPDKLVIRAQGKTHKLSRRVAHQFQVVDHYRAESDREKKKTTPETTNYYMLARTLCFIQGGAHIDILHTDNARLALNFLNSCIAADEHMEAKLARGKGRALRSVDSFARQAGGLN